MEKDIKALIDLIFSNATDEEIVEEVIVFLQKDGISSGYKVDLLAELASKSNHNYFVDVQRKLDETN
ncbi:hypothetical protein [Bacillus mycoides]|uniref:hypothetical protein n=1 Tax=Bacillus mycoides TaxID=1405 RepID=UPI000B4C1D8A|nr:hypothetical protein [Bacillus mycoides]